MNTVKILGAAILLAMAGTAMADGHIKALDDQWRKVIVAGDLDALAALYAPDAVGWFPGQPAAKGRDAIKATFAGLMKDNILKSAEFSNMHYLVNGKHADSWGEFVLTLQPRAGGQPVVMKGRFSEVAERRDGKWLYIVDHASGEPEVAAAK
jgi:uncharacterized protein (TIGR02246 family)